MPWFPVIEGEVEAAEARLGVTLPPRYKALLSDPRVRQLLALPTLGALVPGATMHDFVVLTETCRRTLPGFPPDAVVATDTRGRYVRFWLPDPRRRGALGEQVYAWDTQTGRRSKDASSEAVVRSMLSVLHQASPEALVAVGYPPPTDEAAEPLFRARPCDAALSTLLAKRGADAKEAIAAVADRWLPCASLPVAGRSLTPCDLGQLPERMSPWALRVQPGTYLVEVTVARSTRSEQPVISAVRLMRGATRALESIQVATAFVDHGALAIYDRQTWLKRVAPADREAFSMDLLQVRDLPALLDIGGATAVVVLPTGDGDGAYPISELRLGTESVGLEVRFVR
ncbi:MAG: SMI1/KNR4 family protein [Archangium sp.]|nr:SMI1/KNR4 family protein [Archangium sp.]